jgi:uncharacterized membrane protein YukC
MKQSDVARTRERSSEAENRRIATFETFIARESSQFERVAMKTTIANDEKISREIKRIIQRANSVSRRERESKRARERKSESERARESESRRERERERDRERETRDRDQTARNEDEMKNVI